MSLRDAPLRIALMGKRPTGYRYLKTIGKESIGMCTQSAAPLAPERTQSAAKAAPQAHPVRRRCTQSAAPIRTQSAAASRVAFGKARHI